MTAMLKSSAKAGRAEAAAMDLICYLHPGWAPLIRPAPSTREWMDQTVNSFAYRCLPLNIANSHGWEILAPCAFDAIWDGRDNAEAIRFRGPPGAQLHQHPVSIFGHGVMTFHVEAVFRTPPGWNLWIGGSPNRPKDGIAPLNGVMETDWTPFTFTMNWRFTRPNHWVRFDAFEPMCMVFPVQRGALEHFQPRFEPMPDDPALMSAYTDWSQSRDEFQKRMKREQPANVSETWQKHYYRGTDLKGKVYIDDHRTKLRLRPFDARKIEGLPVPPAGRDHDPDGESEARPPLQDAAPVLVEPAGAGGGAVLALRRREWLLDVVEAQRKLARRTYALPRVTQLAREQFLELFYAHNRPVILKGEMADWPLAGRFSPADLKKSIGAKIVDAAPEDMARDLIVGGAAPALRGMSVEQFLRAAAKPSAKGAWRLTADASARNERVLAPLKAGFGALEKFLLPTVDAAPGVLELAGADTLLSLRHDLANRFTAQVAGRRKFKILPPSESSRLYEAAGVFSDIADLDGQSVSLVDYPRLERARLYEVTLEPGEILFLPLGWWRQARTLEFSVSLDYLNFLWPNGSSAPYPDVEE
ncbi:MAG: DUF6065 family protein [Caulobacterales bacterium]